MPTNGEIITIQNSEFYSTSHVMVFISTQTDVSQANYYALSHNTRLDVTVVDNWNSEEDVTIYIIRNGTTYASKQVEDGVTDYITHNPTYFTGWYLTNYRVQGNCHADCIGTVKSFKAYNMYSDPDDSLRGQQGTQITAMSGWYNTWKTDGTYPGSWLTGTLINYLHLDPQIGRNYYFARV